MEQQINVRRCERRNRTGEAMWTRQNGNGLIRRTIGVIGAAVWNYEKKRAPLSVHRKLKKRTFMLMSALVADTA
jgi:hypothetical protein